MASHAALDRIKKVLRTGLKKLKGAKDFRFRIEVERSDYRNYIHVLVYSDYFEGMRRLKRGELVWDVLNAGLSKDDLLRITLVGAFTSAERLEFFGSPTR